MSVRPARTEEFATAMTVFDSGNLDVDLDRARAALADGRLLVAVEDGLVLGALLLETEHRRGAPEIEAIAVRPGRRGQGIGTALVRAGAEGHHALVAEFDGRVGPFWRSLGFEIEAMDEPDRFVGRLEGPPGVD